MFLVQYLVSETEYFNFHACLPEALNAKHMPITMFSACPLPKDRVSYFTIINTFTYTVWIFIIGSLAFVRSDLAMYFF